MRSNKFHKAPMGLISSLRQPRPRGVTFQDQIRQLANSLKNKYCKLHAKKVNGTYKLKLGMSLYKKGVEFVDESGIARAMVEANIRTIRFHHASRSQLISFFTNLAKGRIQKLAEIDITYGAEVVKETPPKPTDWDALVSRVEYKKPDWGQALQDASDNATAVLGDSEATPEQLRTAMLRLLVFEIPLRMGYAPREIIEPEALSDLVIQLKGRLSS